MTKFTGSLHNHTDYSNFRLRDSINRIEDLINYAIELGHKGIAFTEHETVANAIDIENYYNKIKEKHPDFKVIRGNEIYLVRDGLTAENFDRTNDKYYHFILLAKDAEGHKQIRELSTRAWMRSYTQNKMVRVPTYYQDLIDIIGANPGHVIGSTACFIKGTPVLTRNGIKNIEDITSEDYILNQWGKWEKVNYPTSRFYQGEGYNISFLELDKTTTCTSNHQFLVTTANKLAYYNKHPDTAEPRVWVEAKDLNLNRGSSKHIALFPLAEIDYTNKDVIYEKEWQDSLSIKNTFNNKTIELKDEIRITPEVMRLFGLWLGDGYISIKPQNNYYAVGFTFSDEEFPYFWQDFVEPASKEIGIEWSISKRLENHRVDICSHSTELTKLFYYLFQNKKANNKEIPQRILHISQELDYNLLFGYFLADGSFRTRQKDGYNYGEMTSASVSYNLSLGIQTLLKELGIRSSLYDSEEKTDKKGVHHQKAYYVNCNNNSWINLTKLRHFSNCEIVEIFDKAIEHNISKYVTIKGVKYKKVYFASKEKIELNTTVHCLNVNSHSFVCNGVIVHNCIGGALPTQLLRFRNLGDRGIYDSCIRWCKGMVDIFGEGNFYLEMQPSFNSDQIFVNNELIKLSNQLDIPYIITCDAHYLKKEDAPIHEAFLNAQDGDREVKEFYATTFLMSDQEVREYMEEAVGAEVLETAYKNIEGILNKCEDYTLKKSLVIPKLQWVESKPIANETMWLNLIPMLKKFKESEYKEDNLLAEVIMNKLEEDETYRNNETFKEIDECLTYTWVSSEKNNARWSAYFLNLQKIVETCWDAGSLVGCGRGSGVGFILLNILGITQINPLREKTATFKWRFLNPDRVSVLDVDVDIESTKREQVLTHLREVYGEDRVANVLTLGTEQSKSAIQTAARGLGIDVDIARYLSSMIEADRGKTRTLAQTFYGDLDNDIRPNKQFVYEMTNNYPELWRVAQKIEGLICRTGIHAGGVIFVDEPFTESTALMRAPSGEIITQFDLHKAEDASLIKYDLLSVEALDKIHICLDLLVEHGLVDKKDTLKEIYEDTIGIYGLERDAEDMWKMCWNHEVLSLFQMEKQSGIKGIALLKPNSVDELAILNSTIRLMATEKGGEMPTEKLTRFKNNPKLWDIELEKFGLGPKEKVVLEPVVGISHGLCIAQEQFMQLVQLPEIGGFDLTFADRLRKSIAKKNPADYDKITKEFFEETEKKGCNMKLCHYVWDVLIAMSRGYGFNQSHTLAYSLIGLQELNLAYRYPTIFWDTACLIANSGGDGASTDYTKLAQAIGSIRKEGIKVSLPNVNTSQMGFEPDIENDQILFGLKAIMGLGDEIAQKIIDNRPYVSIKDFINKVSPSRSVMVSLIKSGAFDTMMERKAAMVWYLWETCDKKKRITLQNMTGLRTYGLLPTEKEFEEPLHHFEFNRYLKSVCGNGAALDERAINYLISIGQDDLITGGKSLDMKGWDKRVYQPAMNVFRTWMKDNQEDILKNLNFKIFKEDWEKYAQGSYSSWEMDVLCFYYHEHELSHINKSKYNIVNFEDLFEQPEVEKEFYRNGAAIPIYKLEKIIGTVIARDKAKATVYLLTTGGVVPVKFRKEYFALFDKQISVKNPDGTKSVKEKSWFGRGNKIMVTGIRNNEEFVVKKYNSTPGHQLYKITDFDDKGNLTLISERYQGGFEEES